MTQQNFLNKIPMVKDSSSVRQLTKGYSDDKKYVLDNNYLLRIFPSDDND
ncbi:hypothetical protein [Gracilibacillus xinjiangensis]|uniref:Uncharacterized protein n=1 Tax=Gracilibacillus xinjiangensis TaxID=1193282 RepID=A0ABV8WWV7_9BACI